MVSEEMMTLDGLLASQEVELRDGEQGVRFFDFGPTRYYVRDDGEGLMLWYSKNYRHDHVSARDVFALTLTGRAG